MANTYARNTQPVPAHSFAISAEQIISGGVIELFMSPGEAAQYDQAAFLAFAIEVARVARGIIRDAKQPKQLHLLESVDAKK